MKNALDLSLEFNLRLSSAFGRPSQSPDVKLVWRLVSDRDLHIVGLAAVEKRARFGIQRRRSAAFYRPLNNTSSTG